MHIPFSGLCCAMHIRGLSEMFLTSVIRTHLEFDLERIHFDKPESLVLWLTTVP